MKITTVYFDDDIAETLDKKAKEKKTSVSALLRAIIRKHYGLKEKKLLTIIFILLSFSAFSQTAYIKNDTAYYQSAKFYVNQSVQLAYGSSADKSFAFVKYGNAASGLVNGWASFSKSVVLIDKIYSTQGKIFARGKLMTGTAQFGMKIFIDIEGAIDNNELKY